MWVITKFLLSLAPLEKFSFLKKRLLKIYVEETGLLLFKKILVDCLIPSGFPHLFIPIRCRKNTLNELIIPANLKQSIWKIGMVRLRKLLKIVSL